MQETRPFMPLWPSLASVSYTDRVIIAAVSVAQCSPIGPPPCFLVMESPPCIRPETTNHFQTCGSPLAFWEMQSSVNDRCMGKWREQHWEHVMKCHMGVTSSNINAHFPSFFPSRSFSPSHISLSLSPWLCLICHPHFPLFLSLPYPS